MSLMTKELSEKAIVVESCEAFSSGDITGTKLNTQAEAESDLTPEYCQYRDEGCEYAAACLKCPFKRCLFEEPGGRGRYLKEARDKEIVRLSITEGKVVKELALTFGLSERTIQRVLKSASARKALSLKAKPGGLKNGSGL